MPGGIVADLDDTTTVGFAERPPFTTIEDPRSRRISSQPRIKTKTLQFREMLKVHILGESE